MDELTNIEVQQTPVQQTPVQQTPVQQTPVQQFTGLTDEQLKPENLTDEVKAALNKYYGLKIAPVERLNADLPMTPDEFVDTTVKNILTDPNGHFARNLSRHGIDIKDVIKEK